MKVCRTCNSQHQDKELFCAKGHVLTAEPPNDILIGRMLDGRYEVCSVLGGGGFGMVYLAAQIRLQHRPCVIKVARPELAKDVQFTARFEREKKALMALRSRNTVQIIDYGRTEDSIDYIVMEFIEGEALDRVIRQAARLDQVRAMTIALGICQSLEEAHGLGVLHRDLKPANVMLVNLGSSELVKVIDFGIARLADTAEGDFHTRTGELPGTPAYASYEQLVGQVKMIDQRTDLYALGAILYEMLTGMPPHGDTIKSTKYDSKTLYYIALAKAKAEVTPTPPSRLTRGQPVNPLLEKLILSMLNPVPAQRPTSAGEVRKLLERTLRIVQGLDSPDNATTEAEGGTTLDSGVVNTAPGTPYAPDAQRDQAAGDAIEAEFPALSDRPKSTVLVESPANTGLKWAVVGIGAFLVLVLAFLAMLWMTGLAGKTGAQQEGAAQTQPAAVAAPAGPAAAAVAPAPAPPVEAPPGTQEAPVPASQPAVKAEVEPKKAAEPAPEEVPNKEAPPPVEEKAAPAQPAPPEAGEGKGGTTAATDSKTEEKGEKKKTERKKPEEKKPEEKKPEEKKPEEKKPEEKNPLHQRLNFIDDESE